jgi:hypothetical protein
VVKVAEIIRGKETLSYDERYRLRVANKQKAYKDLFGVQPNEEPGFFLPLISETTLRLNFYT